MLEVVKSQGRPSEPYICILRRLALALPDPDKRVKTKWAVGQQLGRCSVLAGQSLGRADVASSSERRWKEQATNAGY